jgi:sigma-54 dependent transcriptional regulator, acetoin dehydrogenase operon transcriptional activator AcoR
MEKKPLRPESTLSTDILRASWRRCLDEYGLDQALNKPVARVGAATVRELHGEMEDVLAESTPVIDRVRQVARDGNFAVLFCNAAGVAIESYADSPEGEELAQAGLDKGSVWQEELVGTNGIGTCLMSRLPLTVIGGAHFNEALRSFTCCAAPIFAPDGSVIAVLDLSGRAIGDPTAYSLAQYFTTEAASQIGISLFRRWHKHDCIIALAPEPDPMPLSLKELLATDESGNILGATHEALNLLGVADLAELAGRSISDVWRVSLDDLQPLKAHNVRLATGDGSNRYVTAFLPKKQSLRGYARSDAGDRKKPISIADCSARPLDKVAGADPEMRRSIELCRKILDKDIPLLILGETGVGKDTFARAFHAESPRADKPYVAVNCAAIPETLLASELFGYAHGAFTGAAKGGRIGKIAASHTGTLFLDEIGDMPLELQAHLLRVLEERTVTPLGSTDASPVDIKIICATHRNLSDLVAKGLFRKDLYYRIRGAQICLPRLCDRADIKELVSIIAQDELGQEGGEVHFTDDVLDAFRNYDWPGNIRELRSVIRFVLSVHSERTITLEQLPDSMPCSPRQDTLLNVASHAVGLGGGLGETTLDETSRAAEMRRIVEVLRLNRWNVTEAANQLGVSRATLHRKIRRYGIVSPNNLT